MSIYNVIWQSCYNSIFVFLLFSLQQIFTNKIHQTYFLISLLWDNIWLYSIIHCIEHSILLHLPCQLVGSLHVFIGLVITILFWNYKYNNDEKKYKYILNELWKSKQPLKNWLDFFMLWYYITNYQSHNKEYYTKVGSRMSCYTYMSKKLWLKKCLTKCEAPDYMTITVWWYHEHEQATNVSPHILNPWVYV